MAVRSGYGQFCPVAMAAEILCSRWTILVLRELLCGSSRFNELRKGVPRMSPALLSRRLRELEDAGLVKRVATGGGAHEYRLTRAGEELRGLVETMGCWGQRWIDADVTLRNLDPSLLMWDIRRNLDPRPLPNRRVVIHFLYPELPQGKRDWWMIVNGAEVDLCAIDPGFEVDLEIETDLGTMTRIWMGMTSLSAEAGARRLALTGSAAVKRSMGQWLGLSPFAKERKLPQAMVASRTVDLAAGP
jgi:DNA-binding HxlR family transcriptional regulator